jgi:hypothetical protein
MGLKSKAEEAFKQVNDGGSANENLTHEVLAGAAGFEAIHLYEKHREKEGIVEHNQVGKELLAGFAAGVAEKYIEKGVGKALDKNKVKKDAAAHAEAIWQEEHPTGA